MVKKITKKKLSVTVGIPAHNEEGNIQKLLESILNQESKLYILDKVYVLCDGCTDKSADIASLLAKIYQKIVVINDGKRKGKPFRLNELYEMNKSDVVVSLDADVVLRVGNMIDELIKPFYNNNAPGLVWGRSEPFNPKSLVEKIANLGVAVFDKAADELGEDGLKYRAVGRIRAVSKKFASKFRFSKYIGSVEDAYQHFFAIENGWEVSYQKKAVVNYQLVTSITDYIRQMRRFIRTGRDIYRYFDKETISQGGSINTKLKLKHLKKQMRKNPWYILLLYFSAQIPSYILSFYYIDKPIWPTVKSTKLMERSII